MCSNMIYCRFIRLSSCHIFVQMYLHIYMEAGFTTRPRLWLRTAILAVLLSYSIWCLFTVLLMGPKDKAKTACLDSNSLFSHPYVDIPLFFIHFLGSFPSHRLCFWSEYLATTLFYSFLTPSFVCWDVFLHYTAYINKSNFIFFPDLFTRTIHMIKFTILYTYMGKRHNFALAKPRALRCLWGCLHYPLLHYSRLWWPGTGMDLHTCSEEWDSSRYVAKWVL